MSAEAVDLVPQLSLLTAVEQGKLKLVKLLMNRDADVNCRDEDGRTPLMLAVLYTYIDVCGAVDEEKMTRCLLSFGADTNRQDGEGKTALRHAVQLNRDLSVIRLLLEHGADPTIEDEEGMSPLMCAARSGPDSELLAVLVTACKTLGKDVIIITSNPDRISKDINAKVVQPVSTSPITSEGREAKAVHGEHLSNCLFCATVDLREANTGGSAAASDEQDPSSTRQPLVCSEYVTNSISTGQSRGQKFQPVAVNQEADEELTELCSSLGRDSPSSINSSPRGSQSPFTERFPGLNRGSAHSLHSLECSGSSSRNALAYSSAKLIKMPPHMRKLIRRNTTDLCPSAGQYHRYTSNECSSGLRQSSLESLPQVIQPNTTVHIEQVRNSLVEWERQLLLNKTTAPGDSELSRAGSLPLLATAETKSHAVRTSDLNVHLERRKADLVFGSGSKLSDSISVTRPGTLPPLGVSSGPPLPAIGTAWRPQDEEGTYSRKDAKVP